MKKIDENDLFDMYMKKYLFEEQIHADEFVHLLKNNGANLSYIETSEGVELDMQTFGNIKLIPEDFIEQYGKLKQKGSELSFTIYGEYRSEELEVYINEDTNVVILSTASADTELSDLIKI